MKLEISKRIEEIAIELTNELSVVETPGELDSTKKVHSKSIIHEVLWFVSGSTNIRPLVLNNVRIKWKPSIKY